MAEQPGTLAGESVTGQRVARREARLPAGPVVIPLVRLAEEQLGIRTPGQLTAVNAVPLTNPVTAFSLQAIVLGTSTSGDPTLIVSLPAGAVAGVYTGTVTHSVA